PLRLLPLGDAARRARSRALDANGGDGRRPANRHRRRAPAHRRHRHRLRERVQRRADDRRAHPHRRRRRLPGGPGVAEALRSHGTEARRRARGVPAEAPRRPRPPAGHALPRDRPHRRPRPARTGRGHPPGACLRGGRRRCGLHRGAGVARGDGGDPGRAPGGGAPRRQHDREREDSPQGRRGPPRGGLPDRDRPARRPARRDGRAPRRLPDAPTGRDHYPRRRSDAPLRGDERAPGCRGAVPTGTGVARLIVRAATVPDLLRDAAREAPAAEAFRYRDERLTYADWDTLADRVAAGLALRAVGRGDVVALLLPSTPFYLVAYLGAARLGAITTGINVRYRLSEIGHILRRSGAALLLAVERWHDADFRVAVEGLRPGLPELREVVWYPAARLAASTAGAVADLGESGPAP